MKHLTYVLFLPLLFGCAQPPEEQPAQESAPLQEVVPEKPKPGDMILIPAGEFIMGSDEKQEGRPALEAPERKVDLPAYYIDAYEVTFGQFIRFVTESGHEPEGNWREFYTIGKEDFPVANVTWNDAKAYAQWAGKRLPTEAEWEKAARGEEGFDYPWGDKWDPTKSNCNEMGYRNTVQVGDMELDKSPFGVYDLMGNLQEWTGDMLKPYPGSPVRGEALFQRGYVGVRGASYALKGGSMKVWMRSGYFPKGLYGIGFRCARDAEPAQAESRPPGFKLFSALTFELGPQT